MDKKTGLVYRLAEAFSLPSEILGGVPRVTTVGNSRILVENHRGLKTLSTDIIEINGGRVFLRIQGSDLDLVAMNGSEIIVSGTIFTLEFE